MAAGRQLYAFMDLERGGGQEAGTADSSTLALICAWLLPHCHLAAKVGSGRGATAARMRAVIAIAGSLRLASRDAWFGWTPNIKPTPNLLCDRERDRE